MKKGLLKNILKLGALAAAATAVASADSAAATNVGNLLGAAQKPIQIGAVVAALYGGYKVLLTDGASGVHWFLLIGGGALAAGYDKVQAVIKSLF